MATTEEISQRTVKKAKRRLPEDMDFPSPFQGFSGFGALSKLPATPKLSFDSLKAKHEVTPSSNGVINAATSSPQTTNNNKQTPTTETELSRSEYLRQLCCLNESLVSWISQHVKKNPYCLLTPVFSDYNKHMEELERKYKGVTLKSKLGSSQTTTSTSNEESRPLISGFRFGDSSTTKLGVPTLQTGSSPL